MRGLLNALLALTLVLSGAMITAAAELSTGQTVYVPSYSHIFQGPRNAPLDLTAHLVVRNVSTSESITIVSAAYYKEDGSLVREFLDAPVRLAPLATWSTVVSEQDDTGGFAPSFLVEWQADKPAPEALIESVMITTKSQLGISFRIRGEAIRERQLP